MRDRVFFLCGEPYIDVGEQYISFWLKITEGYEQSYFLLIPTEKYHKINKIGWMIFFVKYCYDFGGD